MTLEEAQKQIDELKKDNERLAKGAPCSDQLLNQIDELTKENVWLRDGLEVVRLASIDITDQGKFIYDTCRERLSDCSLPVKQLEAKLEAGREAAEALRQLYSELVESNSPRCDEWSTPANIIKQALQKLHEAEAINGK